MLCKPVEYRGQSLRANIRLLRLLVSDMPYNIGIYRHRTFLQQRADGDAQKLLINEKEGEGEGETKGTTKGRKAIPAAKKTMFKRIFLSAGAILLLRGTSRRGSGRDLRDEDDDDNETSIRANHRNHAWIMPATRNSCAIPQLPVKRTCTESDRRRYLLLTDLASGGRMTQEERHELTDLIARCTSKWPQSTYSPKWVF